ncbi:hypothetical protein BN159_3238 [Streptomyces davaonensis JCM 4913]|uniref:Uncharacterized protein n=1 Tax=Streptomyces davaonensis (strain DSM 101723 / JCM 4913 / KCC S-0913 / 768) TaxID=1214101 RepID=K4R3A2_STRDJ|nr:hypothetical protein [Streptomyces davaonensis]CCK27617.1 hypothetical protein BN159_3238 [Streptomyces davaonensis JCM 4913]
MAVDPSDPETFEVEENDKPTEIDVPEADAAEQHATLSPDRDDSLTDADQDSANVADLAEQARVVSPDEDDYR